MPDDGDENRDGQCPGADALRDADRGDHGDQSKESIAREQAHVRERGVSAPETSGEHHDGGRGEGEDHVAGGDPPQAGLRQKLEPEQ